MKKILIVIAMVFCAASSFAQKASLKGILIDSVSKFKLELATVVLVNAKDTSLISYTTSLKDGSFKLNGLPFDQDTKLIISYAGYKTLRIPLNLKRGEQKDFGTLRMPGTTLAEVVIKGERAPIVIKKDTVEFNTEAFKTRPNAIVEELLRLLPGVQVDYDGTITFNGRNINKLLIDGKRWFGTDPKMATKNLNADMIDKVQMYDDRENDPDHKLTENEVGKILNLKLKSSIKKSIMGRAFAGGGTRERYESGLILNTFRDTLQVSLIASANNLNRTGWNPGDLYESGGYNRGGSLGPILNTSAGGFEKIITSALNINNDYGKKLKTNLSYTFTDIDRTEITKNFNEQTLSNTLLSRSATNNSQTHGNTHSINGFLESRPDTIKWFRYTPRASFNPQRLSSIGLTSSFNTQTPKISDIINNTNSVPFNNTFGHNFFFYTKLGHRGKSLTISHYLTLNSAGSDEYNFYSLNSFTSSLPSTTFDRYNDRDRLRNEAQVSITYNSPINKKFTFDATSETRYVVTSDGVNTFLRNPATDQYDQYVNSQSNKVQRYNYLQNLRPNLTYQITKEIQLRAGVDFEAQFLTNTFKTGIPNVGKQYHFLFPNLRFSSRSGLSFNYSEYLDQVDVNLIQPITIELSPLNKFIGNPDLNPNRVRNVSLNYFKFIPAKLISMSFGGSARFADNARVTKRTIDAQGATTETNINSGTASAGDLSGNLSKQFRKSKDFTATLRQTASVNYRLTNFILNTDVVRQLTYNARFSENFSFNYKQKLTVNTTYTLNADFARYNNVNFNNVNVLRHAVGTDIKLMWPAKMIFDVNYVYNYNPRVPAGFSKSANLLNVASTVLMLKKNYGQIKLSVYDLLNQNISVSRDVSGNSISTSELQILRRYFLLTFQYRIMTTKK